MWWQNFSPNPILFSLGNVSVRWYGLILVISIVLASYYARRVLGHRQILNSRQFDDLIFYLIISGVIGARLGHVLFFNLNYYLGQPFDIIKIWQGGLSIHGALLFSLLALVFWVKKNKLNFWQIADILAPAVILGQAIGRWGNYFNQELYGRPVEWGILVSHANKLDGYYQYDYFQPTFLYESILNLILFFVLHKLLHLNKLKSGLIVLLYFAGYSIIRFFMEFVRIDPTPTFGLLRLPQWISLGVIVLLLITLAKKRKIV